jgi:omega-6 fatty acid desaturase (delta-12 desaturase)
MRASAQTGRAFHAHDSHKCLCYTPRRAIPNHHPAIFTVTSSCNKKYQQIIAAQYAQADNWRGLIQVVTALGSVAILWALALVSVAISYWLTAATVLLISLFTLRVFALMHECGHGSLFRSQWLNRAAGFLLGVVSGMPQYVWSQHHNYHHAHNGNWERYRGPYTTASVDEYAAMTGTQQRLYRYKCSVAVSPLVGFIYLILNPRLTWLKGTLELIGHVLKSKISDPTLSLKTIVAGFPARYWKSRKEYRHMLWNNVVLLSVWGLMCLVFGPLLFFTIYIASVSLAGAAGIVLFTVQHNFEHAYASDSKHWDYDTGALEGTSFLIMPRWLNWITANIAYHHIHHLSARIPNYRLSKCHDELRHLFSEVTRLKLSQVHKSLKFILWDTRAQRIISVAEYRQQLFGARII